MRWALIVLTGITAGSPLLGQANGATKVRIVKYDDLKSRVIGQRGTVVLVDFWSTSCIPCMKAFPHLVELHRKNADRGLKVISVNLDELTPDNRTEVVARVTAFLNKNQARFTNVILHETGDVLLQKLRLRSIPCVYVFDRKGKWRKFQGDDFDLRAVDRVVEKLLQQK